MFRCINTKALCNLNEILEGKYYQDVSHLDYMVSGLYNFISKIQHRLLYQTTKTVLRTLLFVVAAFYFESKGSLGRVESINIYQYGKIGVAFFSALPQTPSPLPHAPQP